MKKTVKRIITLLVSATSLIPLTTSAQIAIIPNPKSITLSNNYFQVNSETQLYSNSNSQKNLLYLKGYLDRVSSGPLKIANSLPRFNYIALLVSEKYNIEFEGYQLSINERGVELRASSENGLFYAIQSLLQLFPPSIYSTKESKMERVELPQLQIEDAPHYKYRGMHLDVSRTFFDTSAVKRYIEWLSYHKINRFHWHLTDDNGWRVEIKKYPTLTQQGGWRGEGELLNGAFGSGGERYGGYYTQEEIREIVQYAADRYIEIIPEIEFPGHSRAVIATFPEVGCRGEEGSRSVQGEEKNVWCVGREENYDMIEDIIREVAALFPSHTLHIGGDEVNYRAWESCPECNRVMRREGFERGEELLHYFVNRVEKIVESEGKIVGGWDEILASETLSDNSIAYVWRTIERGVEGAKRGKKVVMMPASFCYFDMKQSPLERGHNWAAIVTLERAYSMGEELERATKELSLGERENVLGVEGALWAELLIEPDRFMEYQAYPRVAALAEIGWSDPANREFTNFYMRLLSAHLERLEKMGIAFRVEPPKVEFKEDKIVATQPYPNGEIRYSDDESEPTHSSPKYCRPIITHSPERYRFRTFYNNNLGSISVMAQGANYNFLQPKVDVESSLEIDSRFPLSNLTDWDFGSYCRSSRRGVEGDWLIYSFEEPISCRKIEVITGIPNIDFYGVSDGTVEYSSDGQNYRGATNFNSYRALLTPTERVKSVRVKLNAPNDGYIVVFQDLKIYQ